MSDLQNFGIKNKMEKFAQNFCSPFLFLPTIFLFSRWRHSILKWNLGQMEKNLNLLSIPNL